MKLEHIEKILVLDLKSLQINEKEGTFTSNISLNFISNYQDNHKIVEFSEKHMSSFLRTPESGKLMFVNMIGKSGVMQVCLSCR